MNRGPSAIALVVIGLVLAAIVWLLVTAGEEPSADDGSGDVRISDGPKPPADTALADVTSAGVTLEGTRVVFAATMADDIPASLDRGAMQWQWYVEENGQETWLVTASVDIERTASVVATQFDFAASTTNETLPGRIDVEGDTVEVTLELEGLDRFPRSFTWYLLTKLDGDRTKAPSAVAEDRVPDEGSLEVSN